MLRELNNRNNDGISVTLFWDDSDNSTVIEIEDIREDSSVSFAVAPENAADAFAHPYAYLSAFQCNTHPGYSVRV